MSADAARTRRQISGPGMSVSGISSMGNANRSLSTIPMVITIPLCPARPHRPSSNGRHDMHLMCFGRHCVPKCAPKRRPRALKNANRAICVAMCAHLSFRRAHRNANSSSAILTGSRVRTTAKKKTACVLRRRICKEGPDLHGLGPLVKEDSEMLLSLRHPGRSRRRSRHAARH